jgi:c-di-GMP-binding flagellar brake protein YcgR
VFNFFKNNSKPPDDSDEPKSDANARRQPGGLRLYEKRQSIRVRAELPARFWVLRKDKTPLEPGVSAKTVNISGTGVLIVVDRREFLAEGNLLNLRITFPGDDMAYAQGRVVRTVWKPGFDPRYEIGLQFTEITNANQKKIMKFIFSKQLELRKSRK